MRLQGAAARGRAFAAALLAAGVLALSGAPAVATGSTPSSPTVPTGQTVQTAQTGQTGSAQAGAARPASPSTDTLPVSVSVTAVTPQVLQPGEDLTVTATLRNDGDEAVEAPRASVRIYRYRISDRDELAAWADAGVTSPIGDVAATTPLDAPLAPGASVSVQVVVPAADIRLLRTDDAWGPRGITFDVGDGSRRVGVDRTFLLWASADEVPTAHVSVLSSVVGPAARPTGEDDAEDEAGDDSGDEATGAEGAEGAEPSPTPTATAPPADDAAEEDDALEALTASGGRLGRVLQATADFPFVSWAVDPALVDRAAAGSRSAQAWLTGLTGAAADREVLRLPWADPDLAAIAHAGQDSSTDLLRLAAGVTGDQESSTLWRDARPVLWAADDVPDEVTAARAAGSGDGAPLVVGPDALPATGSSTPSAPATVRTAAGALTALVPDETLTELLAEPATAQPGLTPATAAQRMLAETAVVARSDDADTTYLLATTPRDWEPSTAVTEAQLAALRDAPWVDTETVADVLAAHAAGEADGDGADRADLPASERSGTELTPAWTNALAAQWRAAGEFASVVDDPAALLDGLDADLVAPLAVAWRLDPDGRTVAVNEAIAEGKAHQTGLSVLLNEQFTVISSSAQISVAVQNELDQSARVRVELRPHKGCLDTTRSELTDVPPKSEKAVSLTLRATANCDVEVDVSLVSESGRELATPVTFSARVAPTIESVGSIVVGVLLALALAFGIWRTVRRGQTARRGARVAPDAEQPPAGAPDAGGPPPARQDQP
ncbi:DUF6049 family protein [Cellulomonas hominis]|uniref:DUF6049 family protein n=1 Tax=Cellulomonas hominis TaxID=156981 RepID=UPI001BA31987|nr:DUF6049 family protein [Cellulomonas hominis]VTR75812.1 hypothetical protein CHMI_00565 [Cellulomonas hominis]